MKYKIIYRVCDVVNSLHRGLDGSDNPRPDGMSKKDVIKTCAKSIKDSIQNLDHDVFIIGDRVSNETWNFVNDLFKPKFSKNFEEKLGDGNSLIECSKIAMQQNEDDLLYFVEDDYLHDSENFAKKIESFLKSSTGISAPWFIHPTDYPDQYRNPKRSFIIQTETGYWREVSSTTHTFLCLKRNYNLFVDFFRKCHEQDGNDGALSSIFGEHALCFSPLPGIATHLHKGTYSNYVDWKSLLDKYYQ